MTSIGEELGPWPEPEAEVVRWRARYVTEPAVAAMPLAWALSTWGISVAGARGVALLEEAVAVARSALAGDDAPAHVITDLPFLFWNLAGVRCAAGDAGGAAEAARDAVAAHRALKEPGLDHDWLRADLLLLLAEYEADVGEHDEALEALDEARVLIAGLRSSRPNVAEQLHVDSCRVLDALL